MVLRKSSTTADFYQRTIRFESEAVENVIGSQSKEHSSIAATRRRYMITTYSGEGK
jgi:hypothetical protein